MDTLLTIKAYLVNTIQGAEPSVIEARRFLEPVALGPGALSNVCSRIEEYITALQGRSYTIFWKDDDGDYIKVTSDSEILYAIAAMRRTSEDLVKLYAVLSESTPAAGNGAVHPTTVCDGCNVTPVRGYRYKCLECPDYDLCRTCEARGVHNNHTMIRFPTAITMPIGHILSKRLRRHMHKAEKSCERQDEATSTSDDEGKYPYERRGRHHKEKNHHKRTRRCKGCREWAGCRSNGGDAALGRGEIFTDIAMASCDAARAAATAATNLATDPANHQYLRNVAANFYQLLNPLGSDPKNTERPTTAPQQQQPDVEMTPPAPAAAASTPQHESLQSLIDVAVQNAPNILSAVQQITESLAQQHMEHGTGDGWTVLNAEGKEQSSRPTNAQPDVSQPNGKISEASRIYPDLAPGTSSQPAPPPVAPHANPVVQRGLEMLTDMGFSNESNLLTRILEIHNGDVYKALEVLQVVRK